MPLLSGPEIGRIADAITTSYTSDTFDQFLLTRLDKRVDLIAGSKPFALAAVDVVQAASMEGWDIELLRALRESRPHLADLLAVATEHDLVSTPMPMGNLERIIKDRRPTDFMPVIQSLARLPYQICRISYTVAEGVVNGTGFLVGPSAILTNRHVIERIVDGECAPQDVRLTFDFYRAAPGLAPNPGTDYRLDADNWLADSSPHHSLDTDATADPDEERPGDHLDYALLRTSEPIGARPIGKAEPDAAARGWITALADSAIPEEHDIIFIFQHPAGDALKWAGPDQVLGVNRNDTRVRYEASTDGGSSGAPVFDRDFQLVALHHAGDPNFSELHRPEYNQGIPIGKIVELIKARGFGDLLSEEDEG